MGKSNSNPLSDNQFFGKIPAKVGKVTGALGDFGSSAISNFSEKNPKVAKGVGVGLTAYFGGQLATGTSGGTAAVTAPANDTIATQAAQANADLQAGGAGVTAGSAGSAGGSTTLSGGEGGAPASGTGTGTGTAAAGATATPAAATTGAGTTTAATGAGSGITARGVLEGFQAVAVANALIGASRRPGGQPTGGPDPTPPAPTPTPLLSTPSDASVQAAKNAAIAALMTRGGRGSTILTQPQGDRLGA